MATVRRATPVRSKAATEKMIAQLTQRIESLDVKLEEMRKEQERFLQNSFVSHKVQHSAFGEGTIIAQREDMVTVSFAREGVTKSFLIHRKYINRPHFEKDEEIILAFSDFVARRQSIHFMEQERIRLKKQQSELLSE